jgi:hypothetical protein
LTSVTTIKRIFQTSFFEREFTPSPENKKGIPGQAMNSTTAGPASANLRGWS